MPIPQHDAIEVSDTPPAPTRPQPLAHAPGQAPLCHSFEQGFEQALISFLQGAVAIPSISGQEKPLVEYVAAWCEEQGFKIDLFQTDEKQLADHALAARKHIPLANRPTLVVSLDGSAPGATIMFNAHSDVVRPGDCTQWSHLPWSGDIVDGRLFGRGACDAKGALAAGLGAMLWIKQKHGSDFSGRIALELIPGEEDCVDLGTLTSIHRGYRADAAIVLEPTDSVPRCAARGGLRFEIIAAGEAVHGTVKWLGRDAIAMLRSVLSALDKLETRFSREDTDELFAFYPLMRPITVDHIAGGTWQGMVCDRALCSGYFELCPGDNVEVWARHFTASLQSLLRSEGIASEHIGVAFPEQYNGFRTEQTSSICKAAARVLESVDASWADAPAGAAPWRGFNSGCEGGLRAAMHATPTLVWGPGSLDQAHRCDEYVSVHDVLKCSRMMAEVAAEFLKGQAARESHGEKN